MDRERWTNILGAAAAGGLFLMLVATLVFAIFLGTADHAPGTVSRVTSETTCTRGGRSRGFSNERCTTWFTAEVRFREAGGAAITTALAAGAASGRDEPVRLAELQVGDAVPIVYSRPTPGWAYRDTPLDVFGAFWWWARFPAVLIVGPVVFWLVTVRALPARE